MGRCIVPVGEEHVSTHNGEAYPRNTPLPPRCQPSPRVGTRNRTNSRCKTEEKGGGILPIALGIQAATPQGRIQDSIHQRTEERPQLRPSAESASQSEVPETRSWKKDGNHALSSQPAGRKVGDIPVQSSEGVTRPSPPSPQTGLKEGLQSGLGRGDDGGVQP